MKRIIMITGGQRSGKSMYAEQLALSMSETPVYIATAHVWDEEFKQRILRHQERRGMAWSNIEEEKYLSRHNIYNKVAVIDCITLWCTNFFYNQHATTEQQPNVDEALEALKAEFDKKQSLSLLRMKLVVAVSVEILFSVVLPTWRAG